MLASLKLGPQFTIILTIVFVAGIVLSGVVLWQGLQGRAQAEVTDKGQLLIDMMKSVRDYTSNNIQPILANELKSSPTFIKESVPAFSARTVFERFRARDKENASFFYKEAATNPTNPDHRADALEATLLTAMRTDPSIKSLSGFRLLNSEWVYYTAWPLTVSYESCLVCHDTPATAPENLLDAYGPENGFGWKLNDIIAAQMIYVPAQEVLTAAVRPFVLVMGIFVGLLAIVLILINFLLRRNVIRPISLMAGYAKKISADELTEVDLESKDFAKIAKRPDELGQSASVFRQMAREVLARTERLRQQVRELIIEIDVSKRQQQLAEVVETDFFQRLQAQAEKLRSQRGEKKEDTETKKADADKPGEEPPSADAPAEKEP